RRQARPATEGVHRSPDRGARVIAVALRNRAEGLPRGGTHRFKRISAHGGLPRARHEHFLRGAENQSLPTSVGDAAEGRGELVDTERQLIYNHASEERVNVSPGNRGVDRDREGRAASAAGRLMDGNHGGASRLSRYRIE